MSRVPGLKISTRPEPGPTSRPGTRKNPTNPITSLVGNINKEFQVVIHCMVVKGRTLLTAKECGEKKNIWSQVGGKWCRGRRRVCHGLIARHTSFTRTSSTMFVNICFMIWVRVSLNIPLQASLTKPELSWDWFHFLITPGGYWLPIRFGLLYLYKLSAQLSNGVCIYCTLLPQSLPGPERSEGFPMQWLLRLK